MTNPYRKPPLPPLSDLAAMLVAGERLDDLAATFERHPSRLRHLLNGAGYNAVTGQPWTRRDSQGDELPTFDAPFVMPAWYDDALCAQTGAAVFFPSKGEPASDAKAVCARCDVRAACLDYAQANRERFGIWGGLTERQRRRARRGAA